MPCITGADDKNLDSRKNIPPKGVFPFREKEDNVKERKASFKGVVAVLDQLTDEELVVLVDHLDDLKAFAADLVRRVVESTYFTYFSDEEAIEMLVSRKGYERTEAERVVREWRQIATSLGYTGPVAILVRAGFILKVHAPLAGPCYEGFGYLQDCELKNDEPTPDALVFFVPRLVANSTGKNKDEQLQLLADLRQAHSLPEHHLSNFGSAALLSGLILSHFKRIGERVPLDCNWVRTDTVRSDDLRLLIGGFDGNGLFCIDWDCGDGGRLSLLGCFPLGVEEF